jgi:hypothetical protein
MELLARRRCTGRLHVRAGRLHTTITLVEGDAVAAHRSNGDGNGNNGDGRRSWRAVLDDACVEALRLGRGTFEFEPDDGPPPSGEHVRLGGVVAAARRRVEEWRAVEAVIPSFDLVPRVAHDLEADTVTLDREAWQVLGAVDGRRSVTAVARRLDVDLLHACQVLKPLVEAGAVTLERNGAGPASRRSERGDDEVVADATEPDTVPAPELDKRNHPSFYTGIRLVPVRR